MTKLNAALRTLAVTSAAVGAVVAGTVSASANASTVQDWGVVGEDGGETVHFDNCAANIHAGVDTADSDKIYARAIFLLPTSSRGRACKGWLQRSQYGGPWERVGDVHSGGTSSTAWYFADGNYGYTVRVCVGDLLDPSVSYSCGREWTLVL
ncbi:hypothetical protein [Streptomyces sp. NPDC049040]|uniref:hypothetical protein n=1 Tax=Streptomyces sp. NPDC049040 TaxID=3365593 RepID=UPI00371D5792